MPEKERLKLSEELEVRKVPFLLIIMASVFLSNIRSAMPQLATPELVLWLRADDAIDAGDGVVGVWPDQSGSGNDAVQTALERSPKKIVDPTSGLAAVQFDGLDDRLDLATNVFAADAFPKTVFVVVNTADDEAHLVGTGSSSADFLTSFGSGLILTDGKPAMKANNSNAGLFLESSDPIKGPALVYGLFDAAGSIIGTHCGEVSTPLATLTPFAYTRTTIGASDGSASNASQDAFAGDLAELIVYNRSLPALERDSVIAYLTEKYGITVPDPTGDDTDGDGFRNECDVDDDGDGLSDAEELTLGTNPLLPDTDGDGFADGIEVAQETDPLDPLVFPTDPVLVTQFNPVNVAGLCGLGFDASRNSIWVYGCSAVELQRYSTTGVLLGSIPRPGEAADDVDIDVVSEAFLLKETPVEPGDVLFINGETSMAEVYALDNSTGAPLESLDTMFGASHVVGGAHHSARGTIFLVQDRQTTSAAEANRIAEVGLEDGTIVNTFQTTDLFSINFGDLDVCAATGNLLLVSSDEPRIGEFTPDGMLVRSYPLPIGVSSLSGIGIDDTTGRVWVSGTNGIVSLIDGLFCR